MPELAEVNYFRKQWDLGLTQKILSVELHPKSRIFRGTPSARLSKGLAGEVLTSSHRHGKQMLFRLGNGASFGVHLGMTGELRVEAVGFAAGKHDHFVLRQKQKTLVFSDPRHFGRILFHAGPELPAWWTQLPPEVLSPDFTIGVMGAFLKRRAKAPLKAVLLMQERFPGIGNWMADEILWRAAIHPRAAAGSLSPSQVIALYREIQFVSAAALATIGRDFQDPPKSWLFPHRWTNGGICPRTQTPLIRETIGGRTTCWSPGRQTLSVDPKT